MDRKWILLKVYLKSAYDSMPSISHYKYSYEFMLELERNEELQKLRDENKKLEEELKGNTK